MKNQKTNQLVKNFADLLERVRGLPRRRVVVVSAADADTMAVVKRLRGEGIADCVLVGEGDRIRELAGAVELELPDGDIVSTGVSGDAEMVRTALSLIHEGRADLIMKGRVHTAEFLRPILDRGSRMLSGRLLSQASVFEKDGRSGLMMMSDCALNIRPGLEQKRGIIENGIRLAAGLGYDEPRVAVLSALEVVNPDMVETVEAAVLSKMAERGQLGRCIVDGPLALDNAVSLRAASNKELGGEVAGRADLLIVPDIQVGNSLHKALIYFAGKTVAGLVMGARAPIIMSSRTDTVDSRVLSVALCSYLSHMGELS